MASILIGIVTICYSWLKWNYLKNDKDFFNFLFHFWNLHPFLNILKNKMVVIALAFPKLQTVKQLLRTLSKKRPFRRPFESQHVKGSQTLVESVWQHLYQILSKLQGKLKRKTSPLVICEILGVFVNIFISDDKYPVRDFGNSLLPIQRQLS